MEIRQTDGVYKDFLYGRVDNELVNCVNRAREQAWEILKSAVTCKSLGEISSEELEGVYKKVFGVYPQFEESMRRELAECHGLHS
jgi:hypothetical protein